MYDLQTLQALNQQAEARKPRKRTDEEKAELARRVGLPGGGK